MASSHSTARRSGDESDRAVRARLAWPYLVGLAVLVALPALAAAGLAFTEYSGIQAPRFNGIENLERLFADDDFHRALFNSAIFVLIAVPLRIGGALGFALLLHKRSRGHGVARAAAYLPTVVPEAAYALLWLWLFNPLFGPLPLALDALGLPSPAWLTDPWGARVALPLMGAFQIGEAFVVALAARRAIPHSLYEVAEVDGAGPFFTLTRITLPLMAPALVLLVLRDAIFSFQMNFVPSLLVTDGGPRYATTYVSLYLYRQAFRYFRLGYASTIALSMFAITALIVGVQYLLARRWRLA